MRKSLLATTVVGALLAGCSPFAFNIKGYAYNEENLYEAWAKVSSHKYFYDFGEYWSSPSEFEAKGGGDCEDFAIALVYKLGKNASSVCIRKPDGSFHEIVKYGDRFLEPQRFGMYYEKKDLKILWVMNYDETMSISTLWGAKQGNHSPEIEKDTCTASVSL